MSKAEAVLHTLVASALITICHGQEGSLYELGFIFAGILLGGVAWSVLNEENGNE
jgi:hypothetical protein